MTLIHRPIGDLGALANPDLVGGIYSVLKSKAPVTTAEYGERYTLIGPLNHQSVRNSCLPYRPRSFTDDYRLPSRLRSWSRPYQSLPQP